ncbi:MAG: PASTA domain-containing protein [Clostridia bacterium]|nr:PASTA domain-containing protein [Clostridia bacterium]
MKAKDNSLKKAIAAATVSALVFAVTSICVFAFFFVSNRRHRETVTIPSFVGQQFSSIMPVDRITVEHELVFSDEVPAGEVISQFPYAGARRKVADGDAYTVKLTVSLGKEQLRVPTLASYGYLEAAAALRMLGARVRVVSIYNGDADHDTVLSTSPAAGEMIEAGQQVTLFVSRHRVEGSILVRDFTGMPQEQACAELLSDGFLVGEIELVCSDEGEAGCVIGQSLAPGTYVRHESRIDLTVSAGKNTEEKHPFGRGLTEGAHNGE